ncbi:MAG: hypothetical protein IH845_01140 [Nanoarchaeota archaeon]|nr:hypothetical protein [Nanoarchaeota archaeon]
MEFCNVSWWLDIVAILILLGFNVVGIFSKWLRENFGIPKNIIQSILAAYLIVSVILCRPF